MGKIGVRDDTQYYTGFDVTHTLTEEPVITPYLTTRTYLLRNVSRYMDSQKDTADYIIDFELNEETIQCFPPNTFTKGILRIPWTTNTRDWNLVMKILAVQLKSGVLDL